MEGRPLDEPELVELARKGDVNAYEELMRTYTGLAHRAAFLVTRDAAEADDAVQTAFIKAYYALERFHRGAAFRPWLLKIVTNEARNRVRSSARVAGMRLRLAHSSPSGDATPSPEGEVLAGETRAALAAAVDSLPAKQRLAVTYRYFLGLSEAETAAALGWPPGSVKSRLSRALTRLKVVLEREEQTDTGVPP